jgi:hypothetical protein
VGGERLSRCGRSIPLPTEADDQGRRHACTNILKTHAKALKSPDIEGSIGSKKSRKGDCVTVRVGIRCLISSVFDVNYLYRKTFIFCTDFEF